MKSINTSIFDFPTLITGGFVYVDKTAQLYELARPNADRIYYLPRPIRAASSTWASATIPPPAPSAPSKPNAREKKNVAMLKIGKRTINVVPFWDWEIREKK